MLNQQYENRIKTLSDQLEKAKQERANVEAFKKQVNRLKNERDSLQNIINKFRGDNSLHQKGKLFGWGYDYPPKEKTEL